MLAGVVWLVGLALLLRPAALRALERGRFRGLVRVVHPVVLTAYLWHVSALFVGAAVWRAVGFPDPEIGSGAWWALRPVWLAVLALPFAVVVAVFRWFEVHPAVAAPRPAPLRLAAAGFGVVALAVGVLGYGETGFLPFAPDVGEKILMFRFTPLQNIVHLAVGALAFEWAYRRSAPALGALVASAGFLAVGAFHESAALDGLGMNGASAIAHLAVGGAGLAALASAAALTLARRRAGRDYPEPRGTS